MSDVGSNSLLTAFVELRAKASNNFESEAREQVLPGVKRLAEDAALAFASSKIFNVGKAGVDELASAEKVTAQTAVTLKNLGATAGVTMTDVDALSTAMLRQSGVDDEVAKAAENVLLRMGVTGESFKRATQDANDLSVAMGTDMTSAAELLGRALAHPEQAARLLKPAIGGLTVSQLDAIKSFQEMGDAAGAQGVIFDALESKVKGSASAYGETLPGQLAIAKESITNAKAALVGGLAPALQNGANLATALATRFQELPEPLQETIGTIALVGGGLGALIRPAADVVRLVTTMREAHVAAATAAAAQATAEGGLAVAEDAVAVNSAATVAPLYASATASTAAGAGVAGFAATAAAALGPLGLLAAAIIGVHEAEEQLGGAFTRHDPSLFQVPVQATEGFGHLADQLRAVLPPLNALPGSSDETTAAMQALSQAAAAASASVAGVRSSAATGLLASTGAIEAAESRVADAHDKVRVAGERLNGGVQREQAALAEAVEAASQRIVDAQQRVIDARQAVADAEEKLAHAGEHESLAVNDAQDAVDAAQRKLNASTPEERGPAQHALDDAKQKLQDAKEALERAKPDAERALDAAVRGVADASRAEADAHRELRDAQDRQVEGSHLAEQAQRDYDSAIRGVNDAVLAQAQAVADQKRLQEELATGLKTGPVEALGQLKAAYKAAADELDPNSPDTARLLYLLASLSGAPIEVTFGAPGGGSSPGRVSRRAAGGPVGAGEVFMGAEYGPELLMLNQGPGLYRSPGAGVVYPTGTGPAEHRTVEEHHYHMHLNATVTIDAVRREFDRMMVFRESSRSLVGAGG